MQSNGTGVATLYYTNGTIRSEHSFTNDISNGKRFLFYESGHPKCLEWYVGGHPAHQVVGFHADGTMLSFSFVDKNGNITGPTVIFDEHGKEIERSYHYANKELSEAEYKEIAKNKQGLPSGDFGTNYFKEFLDRNIRPELEKYRCQKKGSIPVFETEK